MATSDTRTDEAAADKAAITRAETGTAEPPKHPSVLKRRGLLAGAAALVAGMVAQRTAQPVAAAASMQFANTTTTAINNALGQTDLIALSGFNPNGIALLYVDASTLTTGFVQAIVAMGGGGIGVHASSDTGLGVYAISRGDHAVYGQVFMPPSNSGKAGVYGQGYGSSTFGVIGDGNGGVGMQGQGAQYGVVGLTDNINNSIAVFGNNTSTAANPIGVYGTAKNGTGVVGVTNTAFTYGVLGQTLATNSTAIAGTCTANGSSAFSGGTTNPNAYAGVFQGNVVIQGRLVVSDPSYKSGALAHPDGSTRLVYCVESPESWIEDFGKGMLVNGTAKVPFDPDFAAVVHTDDYHVFLTSRDGGNKGLAVSGQRGDGFTVQELHDGTSSGAFSWRVVAKPKSTVKQERLAKFVMPTLKLPDANALPKPAPPKAAAPPKTP